TSSISFYFSSSVELRALHSFPTRRSSDLTPARLRERVRFLLERYAEPVLVETYLPGPEFTVAILGNGPEAACLPVIGLDFSALRSEEHTSELQSRFDLVCRLLLEKKNFKCPKLSFFRWMGVIASILKSSNLSVKLHDYRILQPYSARSHFQP